MKELITITVLENREKDISFLLDKGAGNSKPYEGSYRVTPKKEAQLLMTKGKRMKDDLAIEAIPKRFGEVFYDGRTILIR